MNSNNVPYRISTYDKHKIIVLKEQGLSVTDIANELGITDNSGVHNSRFTQAWFSRNPNFVNSLPWPPKSPDLNPIENLWGLMVQEWDSNQARTREALVRHVHEIWDSFRGNNVCYNMVSSMQERLQDVINAEGGYTRF